MSQVSLTNQALGHLNVNSINSMDEDTKAARKAKLFFEPTLKAALRSQDWNFAIKRQALAADPAQSVWGGLNKFALPTDYIRFVNAERDNWMRARKIEGQFVVTKESAPLNIRYIAYVTDDSTYDASFVEMFVLQLAKKLWKTLSGDKATLDKINQDLAEAMSSATMLDAIEDTPESYLDPDEQDVIAARWGN